MDWLLEQIADHAFKPSACHHIAVGLNCKVTVSAMASVIDGIGIAIIGNFEESTDGL